MARNEARDYEVQGYTLECPVCHHPRFGIRRSLVNTAATIFFNIDWANRQATNVICERRGHITWVAPSQRA